MAARRKIERTCHHCVHFIDSPAAIEARIPNLTVFGSAYSAARGAAGVCREFDRFMDPLPATSCPAFADCAFEDERVEQ